MLKSLDVSLMTKTFAYVNEKFQPDLSSPPNIWKPNSVTYDDKDTFLTHTNIE